MKKNEILEEVRVRSDRKSLQFPEDINIEESNGIVMVTISASGIFKNMQENASAFEGWILGMKAIKNEWSFVLRWNEPEKLEKSNGHYQRFLYRVSKFDEMFGRGSDRPWFSIAKDCSLGDLKISPNGESYMLNHPSSSLEDRTNDSTDSRENALENALVKTPPESLVRLFDIREGKLYRQLPMGLFKDKVSNDNPIFTGGKSGADLWAVSNDNALILFELKAEKNNKVGVITELFFYAMVLADEQHELFHREHEAGQIIRETKSLKAMVLSPGIHPLITEDVFKVMNANKIGVEFGYVRVDPKSPYNCKRIF